MGRSDGPDECPPSVASAQRPRTIDLIEPECSGFESSRPEPVQPAGCPGLELSNLSPCCTHHYRCAGTFAKS